MNLLITGASSDIGVELIKSIADNYDCIWAHYNSNPNAFNVISELRNSSVTKIIPVQADFSNTESVAAMLNLIADSQKFPDHVVHLSASKTKNKLFNMWATQDFNDEFTVAVSSIVEILNTLIPKMAANRYGKIVFMLSSFVAGVSPKYQSPYIVSKFALLGLMKNLAAEYSSKGITVNGISPDMIDTKFNDLVVRKIKELNAENSPLGRNLKVSDVIPAIKFLLSEEADTISGANIPITAGTEIK